MYVLLQFLWFFTCVSWGISPAQILLIVQTTAICHSIFYFSSFYLCLFNLEFQNLLLSVLSVLSCVLFCSLSFFHPTPFYSSFYSLFCFLPLFIHFIFRTLYCFLFKSVILTFLFSFPITLSSLLLPYALFLFNLFSF